MIDSDDTAPNGEFYVGPTYNHMIKTFGRSELVFIIFLIGNIIQLGFQMISIAYLQRL